jgi:hypothetical protein
MKNLLLSCLVILALTLGFGCSDDDPASPPSSSGGGSTKADILVLDDDSTGTDLVSILVAAGNAVTMGGSYYDYAGTDFSAYDLVIFLSGYDYGSDLMPGVEQGMKDFVMAGGVLVTTEYMTYSFDAGAYLPLIEDFLPLKYNDAYCDDSDGTCTETYTKNGSHAITAGLPATFVTPTNSTYSLTVVNPTSSSTNIEVLFTGANSGAALGIGQLGTGHTIHWNMGGVYGGTEIWDTNTKRILTNIAEFADAN